MMYPNLKFPRISHRPFFYTNFVSTIDGKVQVIENPTDYWPIGSKTDYQTLIELRAYADVLIHGKNTALSHRTVDSIGTKSFKDLRKKIGKKKDLLYIVMSNRPSSKLYKQLENKHGIIAQIMSSDLVSLSRLLYNQGHKHILVEGGPHVLGSFLKHDLIGEVFLTIAPKIFGNEENGTLTMSEGYLFPPDEIKKFNLISVKKVKDEVYLRYGAVSLSDTA